MEQETVIKIERSTPWMFIIFVSLTIYTAFVVTDIKIKMNTIEHKVNCIMTGEDVKEAQE